MALERQTVQILTIHRHCDDFDITFLLVSYLHIQTRNTLARSFNLILKPLNTLTERHVLHDQHLVRCQEIDLQLRTPPRLADLGDKINILDATNNRAVDHQLRNPPDVHALDVGREGREQRLFVLLREHLLAAAGRGEEDVQGLLALHAFAEYVHVQEAQEADLEACAEGGCRLLLEADCWV